jgi:hypothetical protein
MLVLAATAAAAQDTVEREARVRVTTPTAQVAGYLSDVDSTYLHVYTHAGRSFTFGRTEISRLEVRHSRAGRGVKILGITGLVGGAALGAYAAALGFDHPDRDSVLQGMAAGGLVFGSVGALTGGLIGSFFPVWTPVDPARASFSAQYRP